MSRRAAVALVAAALTLSGCRVTGLIFHDDHHLAILSPAKHASITLPTTVQWAMRGAIAANALPARFGVFVDRTPIKPGQNLRAVAHDDEICKRTPGCPDEQYLERQNVYITTQTQLTLTGLPDNRRQNREGARDAHVVTIVFVDAAGRRIDERAYSVEFTVNHLTCRGGNGSRVQCQ